MKPAREERKRWVVVGVGEGAQWMPSSRVTVLDEPVPEELQAALFARAGLNPGVKPWALLVEATLDEVAAETLFEASVVWWEQAPGM